MAGKEKVDIKRSDQFQEMDEALTKAMAELDSTIDRVSAIFHAEETSKEPASENEDAELPAEAAPDTPPEKSANAEAE